jgi:hypothetical protein
MTWKDRILPTAGRGLRDLVIGVAGSVIAGFVFYNIGYNAGYDSGITSGSAKSAIAVRAEFDKNIKAEEDAHKERLRALTEENTRNLNDMISKQYGETLVLEYNKGRSLGESAGYASGLQFGKKACEQTCQSRMEEQKSYSRFWEGYITKIHEYFKVNTDTEMRSRAEGVVNIAMQGRESLMAMSAQLNTFIEQIDKALKAGDLKKVNELMRALEATLPQKGEIWLRNFKIITAPVG